MGTYSRKEVPGNYRRRFKLVYQVCMVLMKNVPDAEDAAALDALTWEQAEDAEVWDQVAALPEKLRLVLYLYYYQGYATGEIAQILEDNPATVRSRLAQARKKLKLRLEAEGYGTTGTEPILCRLSLLWRMIVFGRGLWYHSRRAVVIWERLSR